MDRQSWIKPVARISCRSKIGVCINPIYGEDGKKEDCLGYVYILSKCDD